MQEPKFTIEHCRTLVSVRPLPMIEDIQVQHGVTRRVVKTDNIGRVRREMLFANQKQPEKLFEIRYATRSGGYVKPRWEGAHNLSTSADLERYDDYGTECFFAFHPSRVNPGPYVLDVEVLNGFGAGRRDVHFHLGPDRHYQRLRYTLDLSGYVSSGYRVSEGPSLHLHSEDLQHADIDRRESRGLKPSKEEQPGLWHWEFKEVEGGLVDIRWDVEPVP